MLNRLRGAGSQGGQLASFAILYAVLCIAVLHSISRVSTILPLLPLSLRGPHLQLTYRLLWTTLHLTAYVAVPFRLSSRFGVERGIGASGEGRWTWVAVGLGLAAFPGVLWVSGSAEFLGAYPMFWPRRGDWGEVWGWLGLLSVYLFSIEFFFRGILPAMLAPLFGRYAMFVAVLPYVATHSYWPEALGAVPVGLLLGVLRERSGSLLPGYLLHLMVATEIELTALYRHQLL